MPEPTHQSDPTPSAGRWLVVGSLVILLPLVLALGEPISDPLRDLVHVSAAALWAGALAGLLAGLSLGVLRRGRGGLRRGLVLGGALAVLVAAAGVAYGAQAGSLSLIAECARLPHGGPAAADGRALVDGTPVGSFNSVTMDGATVSALIARLADVPFEDHGVERMGSVPARRCSVLVSGSDALAAFPPLASLSGEVDRPLAELPVWRGELEWWTTPDGQLVFARVHVGGHPADAWGSRGLRGELIAELRLVREGAP